MKVLIATDGNTASTHAIQEAIRLLPLDRAEVALVSVLDPEERIGGNDDAQRDLDEGCVILKEHGVTAEPLLRRGHFAEEIVAAATERAVDVIVVGSEGHGRLTQVLFSSVSTEVIRRWNGAVLVVRHP